MAEDRANNPARRPNLGLPNFVQESMAAKPKPVITKRTELPVATREIMMEKDKPARKDDEAQRDLRESQHDYLESKDHG